MLFVLGEIDLREGLCFGVDVEAELLATIGQAVERYRCLHLHQFQGVSTLLMKK